MPLMFERFIEALVKEMSLVTIIIAFFIIKLGKTAILDENLIRAFFKEKSCNLGTILNCNPKQDTRQLIKNLMLDGYRISIYDITESKISVEKVLLKEDYNLAIIIDADCINIMPFLEEAAAFKYFFETFRWLILTSDPNIYENYRKIPLNVNSDVTIATQSLNEKNISLSNWTIFNIYNPAYKHGGEVIIEKLGLFDSYDRNSLKYTDEPRYYKRRNMSGILFKSVMVAPENISISLEEYLANDKDRFKNTATRYHSVIIENCQELFGFTNNRTLMHSWGYEKPDGDVDGMLKELKENRIDFGNAALMYRLYRVKLVDYGYGTWITRSAFIFQHPKTTSSSYELYLQPLADSVWLSIMGIIVLMIITLRIIIVKQEKVLDSASTDNDSSWSFLMLYGIGELCQQGFALIPIFVSGKIVTFTVLLFSFMIYQFYSASIVSFLLLIPAQTIKTLEDLLNSPLEASCDNSLFDKDYFRKTTNPIAVKLYRSKILRKNNQSNFFNADYGLNKVVGGGHAFHVQLCTAYPIIERTFSEKVICDLAEVELYPKEYIYMILQKRSPFREMFNYCMFHQIEVGVINRLRNFWHSRKPVCLERTNYLEISVGLTESYSGLMLLGCGYLISLSILFLEFLWKKEKTFLVGKFKTRQKLINVQPFPELY